MTKGAFDLNTMETQKQSTSKGKSRRISRIEILENLRKCNGAKATFSPFSQDIFHWHGGAQFLRNSQSKKRRKSSSSCRDSLNGAGIASQSALRRAARRSNEKLRSERCAQDTVKNTDEECTACLLLVSYTDF